eukprot:10404509-Alexandrium_andersonii.AAC.1
MVCLTWEGDAAAPHSPTVPAACPPGCATLRHCRRVIVCSGPPLSPPGLAYVHLAGALRSN